jgi:hypothetical protein
MKKFLLMVSSDFCIFSPLKVSICFVNQLILNDMKNLLRIFIFIIIVIPVSFYGQEIENPGFETWEDIGMELIEPVEWSTIKTSDNSWISDQAPLTYERSNDAHSGTYSLKLYNVWVFGNLVATGAITNGRFHADFNLDSSYSFTQQDTSKWHTAFTGRPDSLTGWFKFFPRLNDAAQFKVILHVDDCKLPENGTFPNWVGMAVYMTDNGVTYENWTRFAVPFTYFNDNIPEYELIVINSGDSITAIDSSYLLVDDLHVVYKPAGISEPDIPEPFLFVTDDRLVINLEQEEAYLKQWFYLIDVTGQTVLTRQLESNQVVLPGHLPEGVYVAVLKSKSKQFIQKVMIR